MGVPIGLSFISIAFLWLIYSSDFHELSKAIVERIQKEKQGLVSENLMN